MRLRICVLAAAASVACGSIGDPQFSTDEDAIQEASPVDGVPSPADYNGDGVMDFALKGSNGIWYIDVGVCSRAERERACANAIDDDLDSAPTSLEIVDLRDCRINDGCAAVGAAETNCDDQVDNDGDGLVNDGCPATGRYCQGPDGFGGRWDFAYPGYGDSSAVPVPADYGRVDGGIDPDRRADIAVKDGDTGMWAIDFADNGFGTWDSMRYGYGDASAVPVPADYDGDGRADLAVKSSGGEWLIDYAHNGFGKWDSPNAGCPNCGQLPSIYGAATWIPVPADYNGDGRADLAIKNESGQWKIDYSNTVNTGFGAWDTELSGYGDSTAVPVPFNYDPWRDNKADLSVKSAAGDWFIDYAVNGFGAWDQPCAGPSTGCSTSPVRGYGGDWSRAIPGDYDGDGTVDLSVKDTNGRWFMDRGHTGWFGWDLIPGTALTAIDNPKRPLVDVGRPYIRAMTLQAPDGTAIAPEALKLGVRYTANVSIIRGEGPAGGASCSSNDQCASPLQCYKPPFGTAGTCQLLAGLEMNPDLHVPASLNVLNPIAGTRHVPIAEDHTRRFSFTCTEWGSFPLGFMFRMDGTLESFNADYGMRVACTAVRRGLYGQVTVKTVGTRESNCNDTVDNDRDGLANDGCPLVGATVTAGGFSTSTASSSSLAFRGTWHLPAATNGPYTVTVTKAGYSPAVAVNVRVPAYPADSAGMQIDTPLEESFSGLGALGISYKTYIDYSRGRTLLHTVTLDSTRAAVRVRRTPANGDHRRLLDVAVKQATPLIINGTWWYIHDNDTVADDQAQGYFWSHRRMPAAPDPHSSGVNNWAAPYGGRSSMHKIQNVGMLPMFGVSGSGSNQRLSILMTPADFQNPNSTTWKQTPGGPIYDVIRPFNVSDFTYAVQNSPMLLWNGDVIAQVRANDGGVPWDYALPRTAVGTNANGTRVWLVLADGEGVHGSSGATFNQLGEFFRDVLRATAAMNFDGGESTELILRGVSGPRRINRLTSENHAAPAAYEPSGRVFNYLSAGQ